MMKAPLILIALRTRKTREGHRSAAATQSNTEAAMSSLYPSMGESHRRISDYLSRFSDAVSSQDASSLSSLLSFTSNSPLILSIADALAASPDSATRLLSHHHLQHLSDILSPLLLSLHSYRLRRFADAYVSFDKSAKYSICSAYFGFKFQSFSCFDGFLVGGCSAFLQEFRNWESAWAMEAVYTVTREIRVLAEMADRELAASGKNPEKLKGAGSFLMKVFGALAVSGCL